MKAALRIKKNILSANRGVTFDFILGKLPRCPDDIFVDASTSWGIGGVCGNLYLRIPWSQLLEFKEDDIARKELLACLVAIYCFPQRMFGRVVKL